MRNYNNTDNIFHQDSLLTLLSVVENAAIASHVWVGRGNKKAADQAAVCAMRHSFTHVPLCGEVVIGEGEMDNAPMLHIGEKIGKWDEMSMPKADIAVDPLDGTTLTSKGMDGALCTLAVANQGGLLKAPDIYMKKLAVGFSVHKNEETPDFDTSVEDVLQWVAKKTNKNIKDVTLCTLERQRHNSIIRSARKLGVRVFLLSDGDVSGAIITGLRGSCRNSCVDVFLGTGGAPEGVIAGAALKCLGGWMCAQLVCQNANEEARACSMFQGQSSSYSGVLSLEDLVPGNDVAFLASGVTHSALVDGLKVHKDGSRETSTLLLNTLSFQRIRYISTIFLPDPSGWTQ